MIKINKKSPPDILTNNQTEWTNSLLDAIKTYGSYSAIPDKVKDSLLVHYRHKDIQNALSESSHGKCAFCECKPGESGNIEVEHFQPKSLYPSLAFSWDNLLPACRKCNEAKLNQDTLAFPIINPAVEDPETLLTYKFIEICPIVGSADETKAQNTIDVCNLNCTRLFSARSNLMISLTEYINELREKIDLIDEADTPPKKSVRITKLSNSLEKIDKLLNADSIYSGFCRWFIGQYPEYQKAKQIVINR